MHVYKQSTHIFRKIFKCLFKLCDENSHENILNYVCTYWGTCSFVTEIGDVTLCHFMELSN